ncbi:hypothetical protein C0J52_25946, partial [Blattella germanica]
ETWLNLNYTRNKRWVCEKPDGLIDPPLQVPLGKGQRFIILHAGSAAGFVPNGLYLFKSRSTKEGVNLGQVKNFVAKRNITFKNTDVKSHIQDAINAVKVEDWAKACEHLLKEEEFYRGDIRRRDGCVQDSDGDEEDNEYNEENYDEDNEDTGELTGISVLPPDSPEPLAVV